MQSLMQDLRFSLRQIRRSPGFMVTAVLTLALGVGANTAIFSLLDQALLRSLPVRAPEQLVILSTTGKAWEGHSSDSGAGVEKSFSYPMYRDLRDRGTAFDGLIATASTGVGIARNKVLMAFRSRKPDQHHDDIDDVAETIAAEDPSAFDLLAQQQRHEGVRHCMDKLSSDHRECVHLVFYEGMSLAEVAAVQVCPENTVKTRLFHARQKLKNCLQLLLQREGGGSLAGAAP